ncbi:MAG: molybdopterin-dependent oxidoreductase [Candidatus Aminicenantes bacterium]|nr:molybdopterin-dependent oxidoreductase [Candidatus Aminicenantes bacterium]
MLYGKILRSPYPANEVISLNFSVALNYPCEKAAIKLTTGKIRYIREPVAAIATIDKAKEALNLINAEYKLLPSAVSESKAKEQEAPQVLASPNVQKLPEDTRGNIIKGETQAEVILEKTYLTTIEVHYLTETHASLAYGQDGRLTVWDSTQAIFRVRDQLVRVLNRGLPYSYKGLTECYRLGEEAIGWSKRNQTPGQAKGNIRQEIGMATQIWWETEVPETLADLKLHPEGRVKALCENQDIRAGTRTFIAAINAETLGLDPRDIYIRIGDTDYPWALFSGESQTTPSIGLALFYRERNDLPANFALNPFGAHFAEVEAEIETGKIRVIKVVATHEVGRMANRLTAESQGIGLKLIAQSVGSPQLRNVGTIGGNLCQQPRGWYFRDPLFPCRKKGGPRCFAIQGSNNYHAIFGEGLCHLVHPSDFAPVLIGLEAKAKIPFKEGKKEIPLPYIKLTERGSWNFAVVSILAAAAFEALKEARPMSENAYKIDLANVMLTQAARSLLFS